MNVIRKPIVEDGVFTETQLGIIGSCLFFVYAVGKLTNGFLADRSNVKRFMSTGLLCSALINLCLGFTNSFFAFVLLWGLNGWFQSMGAASGVVSLTRWYSSKERGTFYGFWSASHNLGEALTFISIALLVSWMGWRYGMIGAGVIGLLGFLMMLAFMRDTPQSQGFLLDRWGTSDAHSVSGKQTEEFNKAQTAVLKNPAIWILALSSAFMYISRYAVNSWGVYYFEIEKSYNIVTASTLVSVSSVCGIVGTVFSGLISDKMFRSNRTIPACLSSLLNLAALALFLFGPRQCEILDIISMILFGISIGILLCFLGGLMAIDIAPKEATGAAVGVIGIASYAAAGLQDVVSGFLIESRKAIVDGNPVYDFSAIRIFWLSAALVSLLFLLIIWGARKKHVSSNIHY